MSVSGTEYLSNCRGLLVWETGIWATNQPPICHRLVQCTSPRGGETMSIPYPHVTSKPKVYGIDA